MEKINCRVGMNVIFGAIGGEKTRGVVTKMNRVKAKITTTEPRGNTSAGAVWAVPYNLMTIDSNKNSNANNNVTAFVTPAMTSATAFVASGTGGVTVPANAPVVFEPFQNPVEVKILEAICLAYTQLEPEFLTCDGEVSGVEIISKKNRITKQLQSLFEALGRPVTQTSAEAWEREKSKYDLSLEETIKVQ